MGFLDRFFGKKDGGSKSDLPQVMPWDRHPSILEFIRDHTPTDEPGITEDGYSLPDEETVAKNSKIRWAPGALDGVMTHHMGTGNNEEASGRAVELISAYCRQPTAENKLAVYRHLLTTNVVSIIDPLIESLRKENDLNQQRLYEIARSFATASPDREPVKFGIAILGLFRRAEDQELFLTLGRHDEFTLFSVVAIANMSEDDDQMLWLLARNATGWGRIHAVERLKTTTDPAIKNWLLREGFRNAVMNEYLAGICARTGGLLFALSEDQIDRELLTAAGEIIGALIAGGPAESIDGYEDARPVVESFLLHMETSAQTLQDFLHVNAIKSFLDQDDSHWASRYEKGWSVESRESLRRLCNQIRNRPEWVAKATASLSSEDPAIFADADQSAKALGIDTWDVHWTRLEQKPDDPGRWGSVMTLCNEGRINKVLTLAETRLDLPAIATGAADETGLGPAFKLHSCLDLILQELRRFPGRGLTLIEVGLRSPVVRNRNLAVVALAALPREQWPIELEQALTKAVRSEPNKDARDRMEKAIRGESIS